MSPGPFLLVSGEEPPSALLPVAAAPSSVGVGHGTARFTDLPFGRPSKVGLQGPVGLSEIFVDRVAHLRPIPVGTGLDPGEGFEPASRESESRVLPLDDPGMFVSHVRYSYDVDHRETAVTPVASVGPAEVESATHRLKGGSSAG